MPPSSRRGLRRREQEEQAVADNDTVTPTKTTNKRRRLNGADRTAAPTAIAALAQDDPPRTRITESVASDDSSRTHPIAEPMVGPEDPQERQNQLIAALRVPNYTPNAAIDYANDLQVRQNSGNVQAFAKIAARDWCFFVKKTTLRIGRADVSSRPVPPTSSQGAHGVPGSDDPSEDWGVDIDLGPERQVSRVHCQIDFDPQEQAWFITVNSRNGLKLDDMNLTRGHRAPLHSGVCIGIMGTQMLFLLANQEDEFHPMLYRQLKRDTDVEESDREGNPQSRLPHAHPPGRTPNRGSYDPFPPSSQSRYKQTAHGPSSQLTSTPGHPGTPLTLRDVRSKGSPSTFSRGMMLESSNGELDYSLDENKDMKPPHSYAQLIGQAILSSPEQMLTLAKIYEFIKERYAFFRNTAAGGWQNSIRHNLSLSKSFEKVARRTDEPGKGMKWRIKPEEYEEFVNKQMRSTRGGGQPRPGSSGPNSPALRDSVQATERLQGAVSRPDVFHQQQANPRVKSPPRSATPPLASYPMANESYTPDRGPRSQNPFGPFKASPTIAERTSLATPAKRLFQDSHHAGGAPAFAQTSEALNSLPLDNEESSPPAKPKMVGLKGGAANSPPPLYSDAAANTTNGPTESVKAAHVLMTPLVSKHAPRLAPPSTAQVPSQYMNFSSPAPFWKFVDLPSTPARGIALDSPTKLARKEDPDDAVQPSSPPMMGDEEDDEDVENNGNDRGEDEDVGPESPSRTVSRPVSRRDVSTQRSRSSSNVNGLSVPTSNGGMVRGASLGSFKEEDEPEEEGIQIDLSKGFQKIGSYHKRQFVQNYGAVPQQASGPRIPPLPTNM